MKMNTEEFPSNSFLRTLGELRKGVSCTEASVDLAKLIREVQRTLKPGEITIRLKVRPSGDGETVRIEDDISSKIPRLDKKATTFFTTEEGGLQRDNPQQPEMFQVVEGHEQPVTQEHLEPAATAVNQ